MTIDPEVLRTQILLEIEKLTASDSLDDKAVSRELHMPAVEYQLHEQHKWIKHAIPKFGTYFANGDEIKPEAIQPILIEVTNQWHNDLFRLARLTWSLPYSRGYGRRLRFLIIDESNDKLIGVIGMQSPPIDFLPRDARFDYPKGRKIELVNQTMDVFTLGAVPPYNRLLGGKLVAFAAASNEVQHSYKERYQGRVTEIDQRTIPANLVALTTTSAFGRSSIYNRLKYDNRLIAEPIGYTVGYGSFHLATIYPQLRALLVQEGQEPPRYGSGPRPVWQTCVRAFKLLGLPSDLLRHGLKREAFLFPLIENLTEYMEGQTNRPLYHRQSFDELSKWWKTRWLLPRAERVDGWHSWNRQVLEAHLLGETEFELG